jgi:hypothetical protein
MQSMTHRRQSIKAKLPEIVVVVALAITALAIAWTMTAGGAALAGPLLQDSPLAPAPEQLSPLPTDVPSVKPTAPATAPTLQPQPAAVAKAEPPIPLAAIIGVMLVIGLIALVVGLRRR